MKEILILLSIAAPVAIMVLWLVVGIRRSSRARTVSEYLIYDKKVEANQYITTMVSYALQLVVTVYFIYWGFRYGLGTLWYLGFWWLGIYLFERSSPRLLQFAKGNLTLHGYLERMYGKKGNTRKLAASCTILGMLGALLIELNFATDRITEFAGAASQTTVPTPIWIIIFFCLTFYALWYVTVGGYKSAVITDMLQLPFAVAGAFFVVSFLAILGASNGYISEARNLILLSLFYLAGVFLFRRRNASEQITIDAEAKRLLPIQSTRTDYLILAFIMSAVFLCLAFVKVLCSSAAQTVARELSGAVPLYSLTAFVSQLASWKDWLVLLSFLILDLAWQFVDMAAWQRIESLDLSGLNDDQATRKISSLIKATKWESPFSWSLGILLGFGLHYSGLFQSVNDAEISLSKFVVSLSSLAFNNQFLNSLAILTLPALIISFMGIMYSTVDSCIAVITFSAFSDFGGVEIVTSAKADEKQRRALLKKSQWVCFWVVTIGVIVFLIAKYPLGLDPFLIINLAYASQLSLLPAVGYLLIGNPSKKLYLGSVAAASIVAGLVGTYGVGIALSHLNLADLAFTIPNISCIVLASVTFFLWLKFKRRAAK